VPDSADPACLAALAAQLGHAPPFSEQELAAVKSLTIKHARDLSAIAGCTGLEHLRLLACELEDLYALEEIASIIHLEILCSRLGRTSGLDPSALQRVEVLFSSLTEGSNFQGAALGWQGTFIGSPLNDRTRGVLNELLENGFDLIDCGSERDWKECRELHDRLGACSGALGDNYGLLVRPGIPTLTKNDFDAIRVITGTARSALQDPDVTLEKLFTQHADQIEAPDLSVLAAEKILGYSKDAKQWIAESSLPDPDKAALDSFVTRFRKMVFYRFTRSGTERREKRLQLRLPDQFRAMHETIGGWWPQEALAPPVQFDAFEDSASPRADRVKSCTYYLGYRNHGADQREEMLKAGFIVIGWSKQDPISALAIRLDADTTVYEYSPEDIMDAISDGEAVTESMYPVFRSYAAMLGHIQAIHLANSVVVPQ